MAEAAETETANSGPTTPESSSQLLDGMLEDVGFGRFHYFLFLLCGLGWMSDACESSVLSFLMPELRQDWGLSTAHEGDLATASAAGQAAGSILFGVVSDKMGRRPAFIASVTLSALLGAASAFAPSFGYMLAVRFCAGAAFGGNLPLAVSMITELFPPSTVPRCLILLQLFMEAGGLMSALFAYFLMPHWRMFVLLSAIPSVLATVLVVALPESPHYLLAPSLAVLCSLRLPGTCWITICSG